MAENSKIEWTDHTFNPWWGCVEVSPACDNCYARELDKRFGGNHWGAKAPRRRTSEKNWNFMDKWNRLALLSGVRLKVFCASMADMGDKAVPQSWRDDFVAKTDECPALDILLLTKRPSLLVDLYPAEALAKWWIGTTVENQEEAERRIPHVLRTPAKYRFLSCEPLLGPVDLMMLDRPPNDHDKAMPGFACVDKFFSNCLAGTDGVLMQKENHRDFPRPPMWITEQLRPSIDWVIVGGESGPKARPMHPDWALSLRDQCKAAGTAFFFKQWGEWHPIPAPQPFTNKPFDLKTGCVRIGKKEAGRLLDGVEYSEFPDKAEARVAA